jgi:hypothetical protein
MGAVVLKSVRIGHKTMGPDEAASSPSDEEGATEERAARA